MLRCQHPQPVLQVSGMLGLNSQKHRLNLFSPPTSRKLVDLRPQARTQPFTRPLASGVASVHLRPQLQSKSGKQRPLWDIL